jgi:hypothetical protein
MDRNNTFTTPSFFHHNMLIQIPDANCLKDPYPAKSTRTENHGGVQNQSCLECRTCLVFVLQYDELSIIVDPE